VVVLVLAGVVGQLQARGKRGRFWQATTALPGAERARLEGVPAGVAANATWALGTVDAVSAMAKTEIDRLGDEPSEARGRVFLRFAMVDTNPDGQAALLGMACVSDPALCDHVSQAAEREAHLRLVAPGNVVPPSMTGGHPPIPGPH
jgi:hypothetical protein